ncbi:hypothetical protein [Hymenobacter sp. CRA2]|uniref:hypothetical protein n=1 Tax=Hymenobacter sp. CRA2 TaxID=1955620 RepID=UPI00098FC381|nr:hypothetical protein [Hymenobacter sp. CRA2]OON65293.1 hypothetical protein B0919_24340 [Hymenobacter sp. CRA2]
MRLTDTSCDCDSATSYLYLGTLPQSDYWLVEVGYYEGGDYLLVHQRTGHRVLVDDYPSFSPSGRRIVSAANAYQDIYQTDGLSVWQLDAAGRPQLAWRRNAAWTPEGLHWADDHTLLIKASKPDDEGTRFTHYYRLRLPE